MSNSIPRRRFLSVLALSPALCACSVNVTPAPVGDVGAGNIKDLPPDTVRLIQGAPACIGRDTGGLYAMSTTCTHEGCDIATHGSVSFQQIVCNCHNATFDSNGNPTSGPARSQLQHFAVSLDAATGDIMVHGGTYVDGSTRVPVA
jgi:Rieske Fe-S protein